MKRNLAYCLLFILSACSAGSERRAPSDIPSLSQNVELQKQVDKELALIKQYYDNRHDDAGYTRYLRAERQTTGTDLNDIKRAREQVLANLHIPIPN